VKRLLDFVLRRHQPDIDALSEHLDGRLAASAAAELQAHLAVCADCRTRLDGLRDVRARLCGMPLAEPARSFRLSRSAIEAARPAAPASTFMRFAPALSAAAALVFAIAVAADIYSSGGGGTGAARFSAQSAKAPDTQGAVPAPGTAAAAAPYAPPAGNSKGVPVQSPESGAATDSRAAPVSATPPGSSAAENGPARESPTGTTALLSQNERQSNQEGGISAGRLALRIAEALVAAVGIGAAAVTVGSRMIKRGGSG